MVYDWRKQSIEENAVVETEVTLELQCDEDSTTHHANEHRGTGWWERIDAVSQHEIRAEERYDEKAPYEREFFGDVRFVRDVVRRVVLARHDDTCEEWSEEFRFLTHVVVWLEAEKEKRRGKTRWRRGAEERGEGRKEKTGEK